MFSRELGGYILGVSGGRDRQMTAEDRSRLDGVVRQYGRPVLLFEGGADGIDKEAHEWARSRGIPPVTFHAAWRQADGSTDRSAGHRRNGHMGAFALMHSGVIKKLAVWVLFPGGKGTNGMFDTLTAMNKRVPNKITILDWRKG